MKTECPICKNLRVCKKKSNLGKICYGCYNKHYRKKEICYICQKEKVVAKKIEEKSICHSCYYKQYNEKKVCSICGKLRHINIIKDGNKICTTCYKMFQPKRICSICGDLEIIMKNENGENICKNCYKQPKQKCSICKEINIISKITNGNKICKKCYNRPKRKCFLCGRIKRIDLKKAVNPHIFRHSRASHLATILTEAQMDQYLGWIPGSKMPSIYVHLSGRDVDKTLLKMHGIKLGDEEREVKIKVQICAKCKEKNSSTSRFCNRCGAPLDMQTMLRIDAKREKADDVMNKLLSDLEVQSIIRKKLKEMNFL